MPTRFNTLVEQSAALIAGEVTSVKLVTSSLNRASENTHLNAFVTLDHEAVLAQAQAADLRQKKGSRLSPIDGLPIAIKDNYLTKDYPTTACSDATPLEPSGQDATIVSNLRKAGAVIFGKTNMDEWAFSPTNVNSNIGPTRNPHNLEHITCGSSGGSAASVASGIVRAALGSDTGGSIRMPSAACGIYGFKPSYGRASRHGVLPLSWSLDAPGPLASSLKDIELLLPYFLGKDNKDNSTFNAKKFKKVNHNGQINLIHLNGDGLERSEEVDYLINNTLKQSSASVTEAGITNIRKYYSAWEAIIFSEAASYHQKLLGEQPEGFSSGLRVKLEAGSRLTAIEVLHAQKLRARLIHYILNDFGSWDVLAMPTLPVPAPKHNEKNQSFGGKIIDTHESMLWFCFLGNFLGLPGITLPVGLSKQGLPISIMLLGRPGKDEELLSIAMKFEQSIIHK